MKRRDLLLSLAGGLSASLLPGRTKLFAATPPRRTGMGIVIYCCGLRQKMQRARGLGDLADPLVFLDHCHKLGAGGIQIPLGTRDESYATELRRRAETHGMFVEGIAGVPHTPADVERFDAQLRTAKQAGADVVRVVILPGRRYERFDSADEFREFARRGRKSLELAEPIAARHRVRLAVENHKDQRVPERLALFEQISSEFVGACVDTGNSFALLEDPMQVVTAYAPWAFSVHLKDQAVCEYEDGFLFADVPLGEGFLDLAGMVEVLTSAKPRVRFSLEMITRNPLEVPCLTEKYWATLADVPGYDLARTLRTVRAKAPAEPLVEVSRLAPDEQVAAEDDNVMKSIASARDHLGL